MELCLGLLSGQSTPLQPGDFRNYLPRFSPGNKEQNDGLVSELKKLAESKGVTAASWLSLGSCIRAKIS